MNNNKFLITNIFFTQNATIIAVKDFKVNEETKNFKWEIHENGGFFANINIKQELLLKNKSRHLNETAIEIESKLKPLNSIDLNNSTLELVCIR